MQRLIDLKDALREIESASFKVAAYDRYYSQGGSESDSQDYFDIQRIIGGDEIKAVVLPPKSPIRTDLGFIAQSLAFYMKRIDQVRIDIDALKGFILPNNFSPGEFRDLSTASRDPSVKNGDLYLLRSSGERHLVHISAINDKLSSLIGGNITNRIREMVDKSSGDRGVDFAVDQIPRERRRLEAELIEQWQKSQLGANVSKSNRIENLNQLKEYLNTILIKGCNEEISEEQMNEIIEMISNS